MPPVAVLIASQLRKELSGSVLFDGVGFKVERADRLALAGPNGAGKTTLLRALAGEVGIEGGELALEKGAAVMVTSHLGRPKEGVWTEDDSLAPVARRVGELLGREVPLIRDWIGGVDVKPGELVMLENCRMNVGEGKDDENLSKQYAALCDVYVMDAFGTAHRAQASTHGAIRFAKVACGGPLLMAELDALGKALDKPARPLLAIVAGSKVSTKLTLLENLVGKVDQLIVGGGIANTFIAAAGHNVGKSLVENDLIDTAKKIAAAAKARGAEVPVPTDVIVAPAFKADARATVKRVEDDADNDMILDIAPKPRSATRR